MTGSSGVAPAPSRLRRILTYPLRFGDPTEDWPSSRFERLALINMLSSAGDAMVVVALAGSVFVSVPLHAARGRTALGLVMTMLPFAVVAPFTGPAADRFRRGKTLVLFLSAVARSAAALMMAAWIHNLALFPAAFLSLVASKTHGVVRSALTPSAIEEDSDLVRANARLAVGSGVASTVAAPVGAAIYALLGASTLLEADAFVFALTGSLCLILIRFSTDRHPEDLTTRWRRLPTPGPLRRARLVVASTRGMTGFLTALVAFGFRGREVPAIWYFVAAGGVLGSVTGAVIAARVRRAMPSERWVVYGSALLIAATSGAATAVGWQDGRLAAVVVAVSCGLAGSVGKATFDSMVQVQVARAGQAQAFARFEASFQAAWVLLALVPTLISVPLTIGFITMAATLTGSVVVAVTGRRGVLQQRRELRS